MFVEAAFDVILEWNEESSTCFAQLPDSSLRSRMTSNADRPKDIAAPPGSDGFHTHQSIRGRVRGRGRLFNHPITQSPNHTITQSLNPHQSPPPPLSPPESRTAARPCPRPSGRACRVLTRTTPKSS